MAGVWSENLLNLPSEFSLRWDERWSKLDNLFSWMDEQFL